MLISRPNFILTHQIEKFESHVVRSAVLIARTVTSHSAKSKQKNKKNCMKQNILHSLKHQLLADYLQTASSTSRCTKQLFNGALFHAFKGKSINSHRKAHPSVALIWSVKLFSWAFPPYGTLIFEKIIFLCAKKCHLTLHALCSLGFEVIWGQAFIEALSCTDKPGEAALTSVCLFVSRVEADYYLHCRWWRCVDMMILELHCTICKPINVIDLIC